MKIRKFRFPRNILGTDQQSIDMQRHLEENGLLTVAIRPPTVEEGKSRLRISLTVDHEEKDIDYLINILDMISQNLVQ